jgi:putative phosphoesterase
MKEHLVGIIADTHDNRPAIRKAVDVFNHRGVGLVVHAGDMISPFTILDFKQLHCPMEIVFGNNDGERVGLAAAFRENAKLLPGPREFTFGGRRFLLMHEDGCVAAAAQSDAVDIIVYGHTHDIDVRQGPPLVINPGEAGGWLRGRSTVAIVDLTSLEVDIIDLA